jgi:O-antigen/teichoic acid export membrane protein
LGVGSLYTLVDDIGATHAITIYLITVIIVFFIVIRWVNQILSKTVTSTPTPMSDYSEKEKWLSMTKPILGMALLSVLLNRLDILMLGAIKGPAEAGIYSAVSRLAELTAFALAAVNGFIAPRIAELYSSGRREDLQRMLTTTARMVVAFTLSSATILVFGNESLLTWYGEEFTVGRESLLILIMGQVVNALSGSVGLLMIMTGLQKQALGILLLSTCINGMLNYLLIPRWGMVGAATATSITLVLWNVLMLYCVVKYLKINPTCFTRKNSRLMTGKSR